MACSAWTPGRAGDIQIQDMLQSSRLSEVRL